MKKSITRLLIVASCLIAHVGYADAVHVHPVEVSTDAKCSSTGKSLLEPVQSCAKTMTSVFDANGRLWSAWTNDEFLYVNYSDDKGETFSDGVKVNTVSEKISARHEDRPKIKVSNNGNIYLSWTRKLKKRFTGDIRFSKSTDKGISFSEPITVNDNRYMISHRFDTLGVNDHGDIYISWLDKRDKQRAIGAGEKYNGAAAYFAVSLDGGNNFSPNVKLADNSCECCRMAMDFDQRDFPVIAWRHIYGDNIRDHSIVSFDNRLKPRIPDRLSNDNWKIEGCPHHGPSLSISDANIYHAVWFNDAKQRHGIFYANSSNAGKSFSQPIEVGQYKNQASHADITTLGKSVYIAWQEFRESHYQLYVMRSDNNGMSWSKPEIVSTTKKTPDYPFILIDNQQVYVSWHVRGDEYHLIPVNK